MLLKTLPIENLGAAPNDIIPEALDDAFNGTVTRCVNLRERVSGMLSGIVSPDTLATVGRTIVAADTREDYTYLLTTEDDGTLYLEGVVTSRGHYVSLDVELTTLQRQVTDFTSAGSFLILRLADGSLYYLLWHYDMEMYTPLGTLPEIPAPVVSATHFTPFTNAVNAVSFGKAVDDLRGGAGSAIEKSVGKSVMESWDELMSNAAASGYWVQPVAVRFAVRLWDGSIIHISEPQLVEASMRWQGQTRIVLPLTSDTSGHFTGTEQGRIEAEGYHIDIEAPTIDFGAWNDVVRGIEVWVSKEQDVVRRDVMPDVAAYQSAGRQCLSVFLPVRPLSELEEEFMSRPSALHSFVSSGEDMPVLMRHSLLTYNSRLLTMELTRLTPEGEVDAILGHGGFLHLAQGDTVMTTRRGNPLVVGATTEGVGGRIRGLVAQSRGGGAYTRQFVYLLTDNGICAFTCDRDGRHTNCRIISPEVVNDSKSVCATPLGIYALTRSGNLILIRDASVSVIASPGALTGYTPSLSSEGMVWDNSRHELWILPAQADAPCVIVQPMRNHRYYLRKDEAFTTIGHCSIPLLLHTTANGLTRVSSAEFQRGSEMLECEWEVSCPASSSHSLLHDITLGIGGTDCDFSVAARHHALPICHSELDTIPAATTVTLQGEARQPLRFPLRRLCNRAGDATRLLVSVKGRLAEIAGLMITDREAAGKRSSRHKI